MAITAGQRITAGLLSADMNGSTITDDVPAVANTWEVWGTETVEFADPGVDVKVLASLFGRMQDDSGAVHVGRIRIGISLDGGTTFGTGTEPQGSVGGGAGVRSPISTGHVRSGTPTGNIVVRAQLLGSTIDVNFFNGFLQAQMSPQS